jgi:hypothetical protein
MAGARRRSQAVASRQHLPDAAPRPLYERVMNAKLRELKSKNLTEP